MNREAAQAIIAAAPERMELEPALFDRLAELEESGELAALLALLAPLGAIARHVNPEGQTQELVIGTQRMGRAA